MSNDLVVYLVNPMRPHCSSAIDTVSVFLPYYRYRYVFLFLGSAHVSFFDSSFPVFSLPFLLSVCLIDGRCFLCTRLELAQSSLPRLSQIPITYYPQPLFPNLSIIPFLTSPMHTRITRAPI
jgi:hypothetical protein